MATQKQRYSGKQLGQNCAVEVDYINETVHFTTVGNINLLENTLSFALAKAMRAAIMATAIMSIPLIYIAIQTGKESLATETATNALMWAIIWSYIFTFIFNLVKCTSATWREKWLPKYGAGTMAFFKHEREWYEVNPKAIIRKQLVLNDTFANTYLEYKATGDYAKYLSHIAIHETFLNKTYQHSWLAVFKWTRQPKKGKLEMAWR